MIGKRAVREKVRRMQNAFDGSYIENGSISREVHIVASPFKTGSSSVGKALLQLGVGQKDMPYHQGLLKSWRPTVRQFNKAAENAEDFRAFSKSHGDSVLVQLAGLIKAVAPFDVFHDAPMGHTHIHPFVRKIMAPKARFIWVNRDPNDWLESVKAWQLSHPDVYPKHTLWETNPRRNARRFMVRRQRHYRDFCRLRAEFPKDCVELEWSDLSAFDALARFYGVSAPEEAFPHENRSRP